LPSVIFLLLSQKKTPAIAGGFYVFHFGIIRSMSNTINTRPSIARGGDGNEYECYLRIES